MTGRKLYILRAAGLLLAWALLLLLVFLARVWQGERKLREPGAYLSGLAEPLPDPQWVSWNGKPYEYREGLINILFLGIDGRGKAEESTAIGFGAKADCIILATLDTKEHTLAFLNISRDSVTPCRWFDSTGKEIGLYDYQLGLQYTMGDGLETSCEYMEEAVSRMLGGIPIHGYAALYWGGVAALQEETGPVTVYVPEELHELDPFHFLEYGEMELTPEQAKIFVQGRDITKTGSNEIRLQRQQEYMRALYEKLKERVKKDLFSVLSMKESVEEYLVTDLETEEILALALQAGRALGDEMTLLSVPGSTRATQFQDEFIVDKEGMKELLVSLFYREIG